MPKPYSEDLRIRVMEAVYSKTQALIQIAKRFNVSRKVIYDWINLKNKTGQIKPITKYQRGCNHKIVCREKFKKFIDENNDKPSHELARIWGNISKATVLRLIKRIGYSYKKNFLSSQKRRWSKIRISRKDQTNS